MKIKICGLRSLTDIQIVNKYLPDYAGFVFAPSKRQVNQIQARELINVLSSEIIPVGVFVNLALHELQEIVTVSQIKVIQLHGDETPAYLRKLKKSLPQLEVWRAIRATSAQQILDALSSSADKILVDSFVPGEYGGAGKLANWEALADIKASKPLILAGGLSPENISAACKLNNIWGVDVSSGVETNLVKDSNKIEKFIELVRGR